MARWIIKEGFFEKFFPGKRQRGLDLQRVTQDALISDKLATRTADCCSMFPSIPVVESEEDTTIPKNSVFAVGEVLYWKSPDGSLFTIDITTV